MRGTKMVKRSFSLIILIAFMLFATKGATSTTVNETSVIPGICRSQMNTKGVTQTACQESTSMSCVTINPDGTVSFGVSVTNPNFE